jgi:hypothetical protein
MEKNVAEYMGDGVYAKFDGEGVEVWIDDGIFKSDAIYFDEYTAEDLMKFFQECFS